MKNNKDHWSRWRLKQFLALPSRAYWNSKELPFDSVVLLPTRRKHESGYMIFDIVGIRDNQPVLLLSGCSDVIHLDGIGGRESLEPRSKNISIDMLYPSGLVRIFSHNYQITASAALSNFEIFFINKYE